MNPLSTSTVASSGALLRCRPRLGGAGGVVGGAVGGAVGVDVGVPTGVVGNVGVEDGWDVGEIGEVVVAVDGPGLDAICDDGGVVFVGEED